jgi:molybdopterin-guanine dinucleotide biosynthesis protein A
MVSYDAVVLAGGQARRLGGTDKPALPVGGRMLLDRVLAACAGADSTVVVGPRRPTARPVRWTREQPSGGGPLPALAAGIAALDGAAGDGAARDAAAPDAARPGAGSRRRPEAVVVLAADLPFLTADTVDALVAGLTAGTGADAAGAGVGGTPTGTGTEWEGVMLTDPGGRDQPLAAVYRIEALRRELALIGAEHGRLTGLPLRLLTGELRLRRIADPTGEASFDCDTWEDVAAARARLGGAP